ncbi:MAG: hypothetical protein M0C28_22090 [Candidatus Moduliflexus flocculans]|nr:hypothetical protein [Candidatus Moduliflexus flocculans]
MALGGAVGLACGLSPVFAAALAPALTVIRATPVLAVILLALIWFLSGAVPVFAAVLMAFPVVVADLRQGVLSVDSKLLDMARLVPSAEARSPPERLHPRRGSPPGVRLPRRPGSVLEGGRGRGSPR